MTGRLGRADRGGHPAIILGDVMRYRTPICRPATTAPAIGYNGQGQDRNAMRRVATGCVSIAGA
ncbi:hypothetical protein CF142_08575 [Aeromonas caviae]|nr:hypothetical protein CF142_08575 [Aeromonas caviae]